MIVLSVAFYADNSNLKYASGRNGGASRSFANETGDPELAESLGVGSASTSKRASANGAAHPSPANG